MKSELMPEKVLEVREDDIVIPETFWTDRLYAGEIIDIAGGPCVTLAAAIVLSALYVPFKLYTALAVALVFSMIFPMVTYRQIRGSRRWLSFWTLWLMAEWSLCPVGFCWAAKLILQQLPFIGAVYDRVP